jgi:hypothetical protein
MYRIARGFGSKMIHMRVKAKNTFSCALFGMGCFAEREFLVFGTKPNYIATVSV